jgi:hypothetical protein
MKARPLSHTAYMNHYGLLPWLLRECVRANPLYVISAAVLSYGVLKLNEEIDPQIGKAGGIILALVLLNVYEFALLLVATVVLKHRQAEGGRDLHGLMLVAALFLGGSLLALDELIAIWPWLGWLLIPAALLLAAGKLAWYARLPGIHLPGCFRNVALLILAAHALSPLWGAAHANGGMSSDSRQGLAWLPGWLSLLAAFWLIWREHAFRCACSEVREGETAEESRDPLQTPWCGAWAVIMAALLGAAHLIAADWVFDRPFDLARLLPAAICVSACAILWVWQHGLRFSLGVVLLFAAPVLAVQFIWSVRPVECLPLRLETLVSTTCQVFTAAAVAYLALALATRRREFCLGVAALFAAPASLWLGRERRNIPAFRGLASIVLGFALLALGMVLSLYRRRILQWLDPPAPPRIRPVTVVENAGGNPPVAGD